MLSTLDWGFWSTNLLVLPSHEKPIMSYLASLVGLDQSVAAAEKVPPAAKLFVPAPPS